MRPQRPHLEDQDLLLAASAELPAAEAAEVRSHLASCEGCRARMADLEHAMGEFRRFYRQELDAGLPPADRSLERLQARIDAAEPPGAWRQRTRRWLRQPGLALAASVAVAVGVFQLAQARGGRVHSGAEHSVAVPSPRLTPGATLPLTQRDVCSAATKAQVPAVPDALQRQVFAAYGIKDPAPGAYEVDYLITPQLGGASSLRNLWPEPYFDTRWNARVKDALEDRLHQLVCSGQLDLATAQRDIARDWIAAYKKYFDTDQPLAEGDAGENTGSV